MIRIFRTKYKDGHLSNHSWRFGQGTVNTQGDFWEPNRNGIEAYKEKSMYGITDLPKDLSNRDYDEQGIIEVCEPSYLKVDDDL